MNRIRIASDDIIRVKQNIDDQKLNVISNTNPEAIKRLINNLEFAVYSINIANSHYASTFPSDTFEGVKINGYIMCKLVAIKMAIAVVKCIVFDNKKIHITLHDEDMEWAIKNNIDPLGVLGYVAINGTIPNKIDDMYDFQQSLSYYQSMGILLNNKERNTCSWMKSLYRRYRYAIFEFLMGELTRRKLIDTDNTSRLLKCLEIVRDNPTFYNINHYVYYLCDIIGVVNVADKNLFMTILSDKDGFNFVNKYARTKYFLRRKELCHKKEMRRSVPKSENILPSMVTSLIQNKICISNCAQRV